MRVRIRSILGREILDSRGHPTIEVEMVTDSGKVLASVPSGASKGRLEAVEIRDKGKRFLGKGVLGSVGKINKFIARRLKGEDPIDQKRIDKILNELDGTPNKSYLGGNTICAISIASCKAGAQARKIPLYRHIADLANEKVGKLPIPLFNIINGGVHAGGKLDFQEFMISFKNPFFKENLRFGAEVYQRLKGLLEKEYGKTSTNVGDEGGFVPPFSRPEDAIEIILKASQSLDYLKKCVLFLDVAASQFFSKGKYKTNFGTFDREKMVRYYLGLIKKYPIEGIEDPFSENDFQSWKLLMGKADIKIIGDDLLTTNPQRLLMAKKLGLCNSAIIKINQIGTVSEAIEAVKIAKSAHWSIVVSHRSGETNDDFIADFAVGVGADYIKAGAPARGERVAKYNRLLRIEEELR